MTQQEQPEPDGMPGDVLCYTSLKEVKISEDSRPMKSCPASYAGTLLLSIESHLHSLQTSRPPMCLASAQHNVSLPHMTQPRTSASEVRVLNLIEGAYRDLQPTCL